MDYAYDVYKKNCPTRLVLDRLADKWALLILIRLGEKPIRFNQLRREIEGVSQKVLSETLRSLERDGLIGRAVFATVPVTVKSADRVDLLKKPSLQYSAPTRPLRGLLRRDCMRIRAISGWMPVVVSAGGRLERLA